MSTRPILKHLPPCMAERAVKARQLAISDPASMQTDDQLLPWVYDAESETWLSFDGNYSHTSPEDKVKKRNATEQSQREREAQAELDAITAHRIAMQWSMVRTAVLNRDMHTCYICKKQATSRLHIHHILKRVEGGTDHLDNLITVCSGCHKSADTKYYNPDWSNPPSPPSGGAEPAGALTVHVSSDQWNPATGYEACKAVEEKGYTVRMEWIGILAAGGTTYEAVPSVIDDMKSSDAIVILMEDRVPWGRVCIGIALATNARIIVVSKPLYKGYPRIEPAETIEDALKLLDQTKTP